MVVNMISNIRSLKNRNKFLLIILFNTLFFSLAAYLLPIRFEENDDVFMCVIASGAYSGAPDAHLVFINYIYGLVLTFFYNTFQGIEWYTLFFCIIHVVSLSIIVFKFIKINKPVLVKSVFILLLYVIELRIILLFQFTTTAGIGAFAGALLLFGTKKIYKFFGVFLFLIAVLVRFDAAMLSMLLMLPVFGYEIFSDKRKVAKILIPIVICICGAFGLRAIDNHIYNTNKEWSEYKKYIATIGYLVNNFNTWRTKNNLPDGISKNDYLLLRCVFTDGKVINLPKLKELADLVHKIPLTVKLKNIYPSLRKYTSVLGLIVVLFVFCFWSEKQNKGKICCIFYLAFFLGILSYISIDGILKYRVFITALFPVIFSLYTNVSSFSDKKLKIGYVGVVLILSLFLLNHSYQIRELRNTYEKTVVAEQSAVMKEVQNKNVSVVPLSIDLTWELFYSPFDVSKTFDSYSMIITTWFTNIIPFNKGRFDSYMSLVDTNLYLFISDENIEKYAVAIQKSLIDNYDCDTEIIKKIGNGQYWLIQFKKK